MKVRYFILSLFCISILSAKSVKQEKLYTQKELDDLVLKESLKKIEKIRGRNISVLSKELFLKEKKLKNLNDLVVKKQEQIKLNEASLAKKVIEFKQDQQKLLGCASQNKKAEQTRLDHLVRVIAGMKPASAAKLLSVQESAISVKLIEKIDPQRASKIFNLMDKEISARLQKQFLSMKR